MKKHFVTFYSPGSFMSEETEKPIDSWDVEKAVKMAKRIMERHGATPYGFCFTTRERKINELDAHVSKTSHMYFLGGEVLTLQQVKDRNDLSDRILISNMESNNFDRIIVNTNSWKITLPLEKEDVVLPWDKKQEDK